MEFSTPPQLRHLCIYTLTELGWLMNMNIMIHTLYIINITMQEYCITLACFRRLFVSSNYIEFWGNVMPYHWINLLVTVLPSPTILTNANGRSFFWHLTHSMSTFTYAFSESLTYIYDKLQWNVICDWEVNEFSYKLIIIL